MEQVVHNYLAGVSAMSRRMRTAGLVLPFVILAACGGGGGGGGSGTVNRAPTANAGADQTVTEMSTVQLSGSGSDPDIGTTLTYSWLQTSGSTVTIANSMSPQASFTAPDVPANQPETLRFDLTVSDGMASGSDTVAITVQEPLPVVTVSGLVQYEFVPPFPNCAGLNFNRPFEERPIRGATVQLINAATGSVIDTMVSGALGGYSFANVDANTMVRLRVRAELKRQGSPSWDVDVRDNVVDPPNLNPPALGNRPLYALDGTGFDTGSANVTRNLTAATGWGVNSYTGARAAAPFAILDTIYSAIQFVLAADATATFAPLDAFWSVNNTITLDLFDIDSGELTSSFYTSDPESDGIANPSLFLLGDANVDTEEFDDHVIVHEWGHYFEDTFSRTDSIGGPHSVGQRLDARLAFGEGWATALSAMALDDPIYCDTRMVGSNIGLKIDAENHISGVQGWFNEISVVKLIYDLWDTNNEGNDVGSIGFAPIYNTMTGPQMFTETFTTVFSFAAELRASLAPADQTFLDSQLDREVIASAGIDIWGSTETNDASGTPDVLPVFTALPVDGTVVDICTNSDSDSARDGNKLAEYRYLRINIPSSGRYNVSITTTTMLPNDDPTTDRDQSDPDIRIYRDGQVVDFGLSPVANSETFTTVLLSGPDTYVADLNEFRFQDDQTPAGYPRQICFAISMSPGP